MDLSGRQHRYMDCGSDRLPIRRLKDRSGRIKTGGDSLSRQVKMLRDSHPEPLTTINTDTAGKLGISDGDWIYIETRRGRIKQKATLSSSIDPRVVIVDFGWWFPERKDSELNAWAESNINVLTDNNEPYSRELGSATLRGILCKVYKAN